MLYIDELFDLFEYIKNKPELNVKSVVMSSLLDRSYGRLYFRTIVDTEGNFTLFPNQKYVSYGILTSSDYTEKGEQLIHTCQETIKEQIEDAKKLKLLIKKLFPNVPVIIYLSNFGVVREDKNRVYKDNIFLTGEVIYEDLSDALTDEMQRELKWVKQRYQEYNNHYNRIVANYKRYEQERLQEEQREKEALKRYYKLVEKHDMLGKENDKEIKALGEKIKKCN